MMGLVAAAVYAIPAPRASACSYTLELRPAQPLPQGGTLTDVPANRLFVTPSHVEPLEYWGDWGDGEPPRFEVDDAVDALFDRGLEYPEAADLEVVYRLVDPEAFVGRQVEVEGCATQAEPCTFTVGDSDGVAPAAPRVSDLEVELHADYGGGPVDCPNIESMRFDVEASDDRTAGADLRLAAYIAADEEALAVATEPAVVWQPWNDYEMPPEIYIPLGEGGEHVRDGHHFRRAGRYCFSLTAIDMAGNESERSAPECIDTTDEGDARVNLARGCECAAGRSSAGAWPWLLAPWVVAWRRRRRR
ncbi:MAG: hypothetical protein AAGF11_33410 [Myxococcota bacterium]